MTGLAASPEMMQTAVEAGAVDHPLRRALRSGRVVVGGIVFGGILLACVVTLVMTLREG